MPVVDVMDDTFLRAPRPLVRGRTGTMWASWLPELDLVVAEDRGDKGVRWVATTATTTGLRRGRETGSRLAGSAEVWLEEAPGGTVVHLYVRLDPAGGTARRAGEAGRRARRLPDRLRRTWKRGLHVWKDSQEGDRST